MRDDPTHPARKQRRSRSGRKISDDEIDRILQQPPSPPPAKLGLFSHRRVRLGLELEDWRWLKKMGAADELVTGSVNLDDAFKALKVHYNRCRDRLIAIFLKRRVTELQAKLKSMRVAQPKLRAAQYYARVWHSRFRGNGHTLLTFVWRTLNPPV
jgi:hypothetical protein